MKAAKITDLVKVMIEELGNSETKIKNIGIREGEKLHELLVSRYETERTMDMEDHFIILPQIHIEGIKETYANMKKFNEKDYTSQNATQLTPNELKQLLEDDGWLQETKKVGFLGNVPAEDLKFKDSKWL